MEGVVVVKIQKKIRLERRKPCTTDKILNVMKHITETKYKRSKFIGREIRDAKN